MKKAVFFDIYGTLIDIITDEHDLRVYEMLARHLSYHSVYVSPENLKNAYFEGVQECLKQSMEPHPDVDVYDIFSHIMKRYGNKEYSRCAVVNAATLFRALTMRRFCAFEGVYDAMEVLSKKYKTAIISDAQWVFTEPEIAMLGLDRFFKFWILSSRLGYRKPDTRLFNLAMERLEVTPEESVYIGDNYARDLVGAKKAGMTFILFGNGGVNYEGFQPDRHFRDYSDLINILEDLQ